ncbi:M12 family metallopeptidase [Myroides odoratimimus]|uniref:M12 family metallopeptidase n=1 Tax=Myroides odoratimimus TaxID=76832 RepID=UPI00217FF42E|nr:M12 family metallopeptidase [Myroides odoratimimus]MCS7474884.1 M12 family metallopeptidase [Myroides odoratimimus]
MKLHHKILLGSFISVALVSCNTNDNDTAVNDSTSGLKELRAVPKADIVSGFEGAKVCKDVYPKGTDPRGAVVRSTKWPNGSVITVGLYGGTPYVRSKVKQYAQEWSNYANITFNFVETGTPQIRVTFTQGAGSYSYLGTQALSIPSNEETMNFGWFDDSTSDAEFSRTVIHEFGHALGMIHEHQHPLTNIPWDKNKVYAYYAGYPNYWSKNDVDNNLFATYSTTQTQYSAYDTQSIMHYSISSALTTNGFSVGNNSVLSATDKQFIATVYPRN